MGRGAVRPEGPQSGLRIIVLFTDGASNSVPGDYPAAAGQPRALRTWDFPDNGADPDNQTHANPHIDGLYHAETGAASPVGNADDRVEFDAGHSAGAVSCR